MAEAEPRGDAPQNSGEQARNETQTTRDWFGRFDGQLGEWLTGSGPDADIVISTRVRLARNLVEYPFLTKASAKQRAKLETNLRQRIQEANIVETPGDASGLRYTSMAATKPVDRHCLVERHLISRDLAAGKDGGVAIGKREIVSIMVNEEDHLRLQVLRSGFQPQNAWEHVSQVDDQLESVVNYAFSGQFGYLTVCPTNSGTGMRASVMVHLPALVMSKEIDKMFEAVKKMDLVVRGFYGEGTQAFGDFYQISNQVTLGKSEEELIAELEDVVPQIVKYERFVREKYVAESRNMLEDRIWRAVGMLQFARTITSEETMDLLSAVRMGVHLGVLDRFDLPLVNDLVIRTQPAHLQRLEGRRLEGADRDVLRAQFMRSRLQSLN